VTLVSLFPIVVNEFFDVGLDELGLGEDLVGSGGPDKQLAVGVPVLDIVTDLSDEDLHGTEGATSDGLPGGDRDQLSI
jgi:hypothetical protein